MNPQFPSASSPQRLAVSSVGTSLKKSPLKPGHSLMDWIRLSKSGVDLRGTRQNFLKVTEEELAKHNRPDDAWMALRGYVYNVTKYMNFHPGGEAELMRGVGKDATDLFNEIHRWVNFESMLKACLIGRMVEKKLFSKQKSSSPAFLAPPPPTIPTMQLKPANYDRTLKVNSTNTLPPIVVSTEWQQSADIIAIICHINVKVAVENFVCDLLNNGFKVYATLYVDDQVVIFNIKFPIQLDSVSDITYDSTKGSLHVNLRKSQVGLHCKTIEYVNNHCKIVSRKSLDLTYRMCQLVGKTGVTHDTDLYHFQLPKTCYMNVPVGSHIYLQADIDNITISRPYTVIASNITKRIIDATLNSDIYLMIKHYKVGALTPFLQNLQVGNQILLSSYEGSFKLSFLDHFDELVIFCAGTGFTPMIRLIYYALYETEKCVILYFFNKKMIDILWKSDLSQLEKTFAERFKVIHVLSDPESNWVGKTGHITSKYIEEAFQSSPNIKFACICGPPIFTRLTVKLLNEHKIPLTNFHVFSN